LKLLDIL